MGDLHISLSYRYVIRIDQFHVTAAIMVQRSIPTNSRKLPYDRDDMCIAATMNKLRHRVYKCSDVLFTFFYSGGTIASHIGCLLINLVKNS
jgi:hypothetical protein